MTASRQRVLVTVPFRLSLAGGGLDLPEWYERHGARVLAVAITARMTVEVGDGSDPTPDSDLIELFRTHVGRRLPVRVAAPVSPGAGLGGSGALAVALVAAGRALRGEATGSAVEVAREAYRWERTELGRPVGFQDHMAAALGSCTEMVGHPGGVIDGWRRDDLAEPLQRMLGECCVLVETRRRRDATLPLTRISASLAASGPTGGAGLADIDEVEQLIGRADGAAFGDVLRRHWDRKVALNPTATTPEAAKVLELGLQHGGTGGKVVGAGGGGMVLLSGPSDRQASIRSACAAAGYSSVDIAVEPQGVRVHLVRSQVGITPSGPLGVP